MDFKNRYICKSEKNKIALDAVVDIPDPVLKKAIQDELGIGDRDITGEDALSLTKLEYNGQEKEQIEDIKKNYNENFKELVSEYRIGFPALNK